jgi:hypothetical protein
MKAGVSSWQPVVRGMIALLRLQDMSRLRTMDDANFF